MTAPVNVNRPDFVLIARESWGVPPDWVAALAAEAARRSGTAAAKRIDYSPAVVSQVLRRSYAGDLAKVEEAVRGALMGETVACPVLGEVGRDQCLREQGMSNAPTSSVRARLYRACRDGCPNSRIKGGDDA